MDKEAPRESQIILQAQRASGNSVSSSRFSKRKEQTEDNWSSPGSNPAEETCSELHSGPGIVVDTRCGSRKSDVDIPGVQGSTVIVESRSWKARCIYSRSLRWSRLFGQFSAIFKWRFCF